MKQNFTNKLRVAVALSMACFCGAGQFARAAVDRDALEKTLEALPAFEYDQKTVKLDVIRSAVNESATQPELRRQLETRFIDILQARSTRAAKDIACRNLGLVGSEKCVPKVAALLTDPKLSHMARYCLEKLANPEADAALRTALPKTTGPLKVGIISSLGVRQDELAVPLLSDALNESGGGVPESAAFALGRIGTPKAAEALVEFARKSHPPLQDSVAQACLAAAEKLRRLGDRKAASGLFQTVYSNQLNLEHPERHQPAALAGLVRTQFQDGSEYLLPALSGTKASLRQTAAALASDPDVKLEPLTTALPSLPVDGQLALLNSLATRPEPEIDAMLARSLGLKEPSLRVAALRSLATRSARVAATAIAICLTDSQPTVRLAAIKALEKLSDASQLRAIIQLGLNTTSDEERTAALDAIQSICEHNHEKALDPVLAGLNQSGDKLKPLFLGYLATVGGSRGLEAVREAAKSTNAPSRESAVRAMADWSTRDAAPDLLALIQKADAGGLRTIAFRGYVRLGRETDFSEADKVQYFTAALDAAQTVEEKQLGLGALGEMSSPDALRLANRFAEDASVAQEAGFASVGIISRLDERQKADATPVLRNLLHSKNAALQEAARKQMTRLGITE